jgi:hypothetical protein
MGYGSDLRLRGLNYKNIHELYNYIRYTEPFFTLDAGERFFPQKRGEEKSQKVKTRM